MKTIFAIVLLTVVVLLFWNPPPKKSETPESVSASEKKTPPPLVLQGDRLLVQHGLPGTHPLQDVKSMEDLGLIFAMANRHINSIHYADNPGLTKQLLAGAPLLSPDHTILGKSPTGETVLLDRWGSPYLIHLQSARKIEFRSPGPDRIPYTNDDIYRSNNNGK